MQYQKKKSFIKHAGKKIKQKETRKQIISCNSHCDWWYLEKTTNNNVLAVVQKFPFSCGKGPLEVDGRGFMTILVLLVRFVVSSSLKNNHIKEGVHVITVMRQQHSDIDAKLSLQSGSHESSIFQIKLKHNTGCFMEGKERKTPTQRKMDRRS